MYAWMRRLEVILTSTKRKKKLVFGANRFIDGDDLSIDVHGFKYMSTLKDECIVKINNLTYHEVLQIIHGEFYDVEVKAGYESTSVNTIFKGGVLYISNDVNDRKTNTVIILCASQLVAKYGQKRLNLSLNSGVNMYSALRFICKQASIPSSDVNVSSQFKKKFLQELTTIDNTAASYIDKLCKDNSAYISNADSITGGIVSLFDAAKSNNRIIDLNKDNIILQNYPHLNTDGVDLSVMPTFNFMCGDVVKIDNSIIQIPVNDKSEISKNYGYFLDKDGMYMIYQMEYTLQNRGPSFQLAMLCKSRSLISKLAGEI